MIVLVEWLFIMLTCFALLLIGAWCGMRAERAAITARRKRYLEKFLRKYLRVTNGEFSCEDYNVINDFVKREKI